MKFIKSNLLSFLALCLMLATSAVLYGDLANEVPARFDFDGTVTATRPKALMAVLLPMIYLILLGAVNILIRISPEKYAMPNSKRAMDIILFGVGLLFGFIHYALLANAGDFAVVTLYLSYGIAVFLIVVGNVFGKTERNFFIGIRLPWTIASPANWKATHRFAGKLMVVIGVILLVSNTLYANIYFSLVLCGIAVLLPVAYSLLYFMRYEK